METRDTIPMGDRISGVSRLKGAVSVLASDTPVDYIRTAEEIRKILTLFIQRTIASKGVGETIENDPKTDRPC